MGYYKFFQIFKFFFYGFTSRRNKKLLKILLILVLAFIIFFWLSTKIEVKAVYEGDTEYTDPNAAILKQYDSICIDFLRRYENLTDGQKNIFRDSFTSSSNFVDFYLFYYNNDNKFGTYVLNGQPYNTQNIGVLLYRPYNNGYSVNFTSEYYNYYGIECACYDLTKTQSNGQFMSIGYNGYYSTYSWVVDAHFYLPQILFHYQSQILYDYFIGGKSLAEIEQQLEQANATLSDINDSLTDDSFDDTQDNPIDLELFDDYNEDYQDNLFNGVLERFFNNIPNSTSSIYAIHIPIPHSNGQEITLYSNAISKHINYFSQPMLYTFIQACWYVVFFKYFFWFGKKVLDWILTGEVLEKGGGAFIKSLEKENAVINAAMM